MEGLLGVFFILVASIFFAYYSKIPIVFIFSSLIAFASSSYMFNLHASGGSNERPTYIMFGIIFIAIGLWQMIESYRNYV
jgi:putative Ca2+/H+ antiporter (TMEM165/GDT1 family)